MIFNRLELKEDPLVENLEREMLRARKELEGSQLRLKELES